MWIIIFIFLLLSVLSGLLLGSYRLKSQTDEHEQTAKDWNKFLVKRNLRAQFGEVYYGFGLWEIDYTKSARWREA